MFKKAMHFYIQILAVVTKYEMTTSDKECNKLLAKKIYNETYAKMIIDNLEGLIYDLEKIRMEIVKIQRLA